MPGEVSSSYDPEFGTGDNADAVATEIRRLVREVIGPAIGDEHKDIVRVARGPIGRAVPLTLREKDLRLIRFAMERALETI